MAFHTVLWACLTLTVPAATPQTTYFNARGFKIPIRLSGDRRTEVQKFVLYVSTDQGKSWQVHQQANSDATSFIYRASEDGTYWFIVSTVNSRGVETPSNPMNCQPNQVVVVDTASPVLRVAAQRVGEEVEVKWTVEEENPDLMSFRAEYQTPEGRWFPIALLPDRQGTARFKPGTAGDLHPHPRPHRLRPLHLCPDRVRLLPTLVPSRGTWRPHPN
jgi:hypothetical protein